MAANRDYKLEYAKRKARAIIKQREEKRGKPLSPTYKKRVERGLLKGKTLQQSRGHVEREHVERKRREIEHYGLTKQQLRSIATWAQSRNDAIKDHDFEPQEVVDIAIMNGYEWFLNYRKIWNEARAGYLKSLRKGTYVTQGMTYLQNLTDDAKAPELSWLYYH